MPDGGELMIRSSTQGPFAQLEIIDTGKGIPSEVLPRIFDAYFSTKKKGSGLGLAATKRIVDAHGGAAAFTGDAVQPWKGHCGGKGYVVAGNLLVSDETILAMAASFEATRGRLAERLVAALEAGQAAGGDRRGKVSAALLVVGDEEYPHLDLRVDEHADPVAELRRIFDLYTALPYLDDLHPRRTWYREGMAVH